MIDRIAMHSLLTVLQEQKDLPGGTEENALFTELNLRSNQPITTTFIREHVGAAEQKGWISWRKDQLNAKRWRITPAGTDALGDLAHGG